MLRATLRSCSRRSRVRISRSKDGSIHSSRFPSLHSSVILLPTMRLMRMLEYTPTSPLGGTPRNSPRWMHLVENLVTTRSPSATWYSMVRSAKERAAWNSVTELLYPSRLEPWPGSKLRSTKLGASSFSIVSRSPLTKASSKRRASALILSSVDMVRVFPSADKADEAIISSKLYLTHPPNGVFSCTRSLEQLASRAVGIPVRGSRGLQAPLSAFSHSRPELEAFQPVECPTGSGDYGRGADERTRTALLVSNRSSVTSGSVRRSRRYLLSDKPDLIVAQGGDQGSYAGLGVVVGFGQDVVVLCGFHHPVLGIATGFLDQVVVAPKLQHSSIPIVYSRLVLIQTGVEDAGCGKIYVDRVSCDSYVFWSELVQVDTGLDLPYRHEEDLLSREEFGQGLAKDFGVLFLSHQHLGRVFHRRQFVETLDALYDGWFIWLCGIPDQVDEPCPRRYAHYYEQEGQDQRGAEATATHFLRHRTSSRHPKDSSILGSCAALTPMPAYAGVRGFASPRNRSGRNHIETWTGCIVSLTTPTRSSLKASRSVSSLSLAEKVSRVFLASYFWR